MLRLYKAGNSICSQKVLMTLDEKGIDFDTYEINLFNNEQYDPEYLKLNPKGVVPTLDHDGSIIIESTLICEYLDEVFPLPRLVPQEPYKRSKLRLWSKAIDEGIFEATRELSFSAMFRERMKNMSQEQREARFQNVGNPERRARYISTFLKGVDSQYVLEGIYEFEKMFRDMDTALAEKKDWLLGDDYTLADISISPYVARLHYLTLLPIWIENRPLVAAWWERARRRRSFEVAVENALKKEDKADMATYGERIRDRVRERREEYLASFQ